MLYGGKCQCQPCLVGGGCDRYMRRYVGSKKSSVGFKLMCDMSTSVTVTHSELNMKHYSIRT